MYSTSDKRKVMIGGKFNYWLIYNKNWIGHFVYQSYTKSCM